MRRLAFLAAAASLGLGVAVIVDQPAAFAAPRTNSYTYKPCYCVEERKDVWNKSKHRWKDKLTCRKTLGHPNRGTYVWDNKTQTGQYLAPEHW